MLLLNMCTYIFPGKRKLQVRACTENRYTAGSYARRTRANWEMHTLLCHGARGVRLDTDGL